MISSYTRKSRYCGLCFYVVIQRIEIWSKWNLWIHISLRKTLAPFALSYLGFLFSSFLPLELCFFHSFSSFIFSFSLSLQNTFSCHILYLKQRKNINILMSNLLSAVLENGLFLIWPYEIKFVHRVLAINNWMRLSMISWIIKTEVCVIYRSRRQRQITQTRSFGSSWYHAKTEFNNCFIIHFHIIHNQKQKRSVQPFCFWGEHSKGLSNKADY